MTDHTDQRKPWLPLGVALFISGVVVAAAFNPAKKLMEQITEAAGDWRDGVVVLADGADQEG